MPNHSGLAERVVKSCKAFARLVPCWRCLLADRISTHVPGVASAAALPDLQVPIHDPVAEAEKASTRRLRDLDLRKNSQTCLGA